MHPRRAFVHVDMDGLDAIFEAHGMRFSGDDRFYRTAVDGALSSFAQHDIKATFFVIARDLDDPGKRSAIQSIVDAGHRIASHSVSHEVLYRATDADVVHQVAASRAKLEDSLGVSVEGFRAPGYSVDWRTLRAAREAGYRYDSSAFPNFAHRSRLGLQRLHPEPFQVWPGVPFFEVPLPAPAPFLPPWHPCYAFEIGHWYFRRGLRKHLGASNYVTVLFHLTDFAERQRLGSGWKIDLYTNNRRTLSAKRRFTDRVLQELVQ